MDNPGRMNPDTPEEDAALNLTDDQKSKIAAIRADNKDQMKAIKKDTTLSDSDRQTKMKELRKSTRAQVWAVLTPDQQKQWAAEERARREAETRRRIVHPAIVLVKFTHGGERVEVRKISRLARRRRVENIFVFPQIILASQSNSRILLFANSLQPKDLRERGSPMEDATKN